MKIIDSLTAFEKDRGPWALTIGNFDGIHLGHQDIIRAAKNAVKQNNLAGLALMTFDPHPVAILHPERAPAILTPMPLKQHLLEELKVDCLIVIKDSIDLLNLSPKDFVDEFLIKTVKPAIVVEGPNFKFGYGRSGDIDTLTKLGAARGLEVIVTQPRKIQTETGQSAMCSSSLIRDFLRQGKVDFAAKALGRFYRLIGKTVPGRGIGTQLGFPTANIEPLDQIIPSEGVYAGLVTTGDNAHDVCTDTNLRPAALSVGRAKTFLSDHPLLLEAHILTENIEDLTGKYLSMQFVQKIRPQQRFENHEALKEQIAKDCQTAKQILS
jgi:riboflavin kinase/FMN adenylyltransferase